MARRSEDIRFKAEQNRRRSIIIAIILSLFGITLVIAGTYAFYQKTLVGITSGAIAAWSFKVNNQLETFTISLVPDENETLNSTIAPGTSGSFSVDLSALNSALGVNYEVTFSDFSNIPSNLVFYNDAGHTNSVNLTSGYSLEGVLAAGSNLEKTWYWIWPYGTASSITTDNASANKDLSFNISVVGQQVQ